MSAQTSYDRPVEGYLGQLFSRSKDTKVKSMIAYSATGIVHGRGVSFTDSGGVRGEEIKQGGDAIIGIALRSLDVEANDLTTVDGDPAYVDGATIPVLQRGSIWVKVAGTTVDIGDPVIYNTVTGEFSTGAAGGDYIDYPGARWMSTTAEDDQLAILNLEYLSG